MRSEQDRINREEWENPNNWTLPVGIYFSKHDSRWLVPKKNPLLGWTFNMGTQTGSWCFIGAFLIPIIILAATVVLLSFAVANGRHS